MYDNANRASRPLGQKISLAMAVLCYASAGSPGRGQPLHTDDQ